LLTTTIIELLPDDMTDKAKKLFAKAYQKRFWSGQFEDVATMA